METATHTLTTTEFVKGDSESLDHVKATCSCGFSVATTLGASSFNRTDLFANNELAGHINYMHNKS